MNLFYWGELAGDGADRVLEWGLNPFARAALRDPHRRPYQLLHIAVVLASTAVLVANAQLLACPLLHVTVETAAAVWRPLNEPLAEDEPHDNDERETAQRHNPQPL